MSRKELVEAYAEGAISRRQFLRRIMATGVSLGAALTYANVIAAERAMSMPAGRAQNPFPSPSEPSIGPNGEGNPSAPGVPPAGSESDEPPTYSHRHHHRREAHHDPFVGRDGLKSPNHKHEHSHPSSVPPHF